MIDIQEYFSIARAHLEVAGQDLQVAVDAAQVGLLQLHADVLRDELNRHHVLLPASMPHSTSSRATLSSNSMLRPSCATKPLNS